MRRKSSPVINAGIAKCIAWAQRFNKHAIKQTARRTSSFDGWTSRKLRARRFETVDRESNEA